MALVKGITIQFYLTPTRLFTNGISHPAFTPSRRASSHFSRYSFAVPLRVGGWVGLGSCLHRCRWCDSARRRGLHVSDDARSPLLRLSTAAALVPRPADDGRRGGRLVTAGRRGLPAGLSLRGRPAVRRPRTLRDRRPLSVLSSVHRTRGPGGKHGGSALRRMVKHRQ